MQTRKASEEQLTDLLLQRIDRHAKDGVTTIEIKSGYGLKLEEELKQLRAIKLVAANSKVDLIATCLAAHILPKDFFGVASEYLEYVLNNLLPKVKKRKPG